MDLVFSCVTDAEDQDFISHLPAFCKLVLNPGAYVFLITTVTQFATLIEPFKDEGFKVSENPFEIVYDVSTIQRRVISDFPQKQTDIALICRAQGDHPTGFHPFRSEKTPESSGEEQEGDDGVEASDFAHYTSMVNVSSCRSKLTKPKAKSPLYSWEKNVEVVSRIIQTFCPYRGTVIYPFTGALSTALACLRIKRSCICIASDSGGDKSNYALGRLRVYASGSASMSELADYSRKVTTENIKDCNTNRSPTNSGKRTLPLHDAQVEKDAESPQTQSGPEQLEESTPSGEGTCTPSEHPSTPGYDPGESLSSTPSPSPRKKPKTKPVSSQSENVNSAATALLQMRQ